MKEVWLPINIPDLRDYYLISESGKIWSKKTNKQLSPRIGNKGYYQITIGHRSKLRTYLVHRLLALTFIPLVESKFYINHKDGNKRNNSLENLEWCTFKENIQHSVRTGLSVSLKGTQKTQAVLTETKVKEIRKLYSTGDYSQDELAFKFKVHRSSIWRAIHNKNWKHVN